MEYINVGQKNATFHLFHGDCEDYRREFVLPLENVLNDKGQIKIFLDFRKLSYLSQREALAVERLKQTLDLLNLEYEYENMQPSVSLAFSRWMSK
ncbi:MAG: hypothetical protein KC478_01730 [Bacteriovoracaceae bacterium]|nr:hypothetical protein [Bacteriovoracaceae bacterium]